MQGLISAVVVLSVATIAVGEWTPDPDCPYPQTTVYRFPYAGDCNKYWECFGGAKYVQECPTGLEFNAPKMQCDTPELAHCNHTEPTGTTGRPTSPQPPTTWTPNPLCPFPSDDVVYFNYPGDCTKYYECFAGNRYTRQCPKGLYWNEPISECDYPENVDCGRSTSPSGPTTNAPTRRPTTTPSGRTTTWTPDPLCPYPSTDVIYFHYPGNCSRYYECFAGHKFLRECPSNLYWHQAIEQCDYAANVPDCVSGTTKATEPTPAPTVKCLHTDTVTTYFPYPGDCQKYFMCYEGRSYVQKCPIKLYWNQDLLKCDFRTNVKC